MVIRVDFADDGPPEVLKAASSFFRTTPLHDPLRKRRNGPAWIGGPRSAGARTGGAREGQGRRQGQGQDSAPLSNGGFSVSPKMISKWSPFQDLSEVCSRRYQRRLLRLKQHLAAFFDLCSAVRKTYSSEFFELHTITLGSFKLLYDF